MLLDQREDKTMDDIGDMKGNIELIPGLPCLRADPSSKSSKRASKIPTSKHLSLNAEHSVWHHLAGF